MSEQKTIENKFKDTLSGDLLANALDLIDYMRKIGMTNGEDSSDDRFYYKDELMCIFITFQDEHNPSGGLMIFDCPLSGHDGFPIDESVQEFVRTHVNKCGGCGGDCGHKERGATKMIFGTEYDNLCSSEIAFFSPDTEAMEKIKTLMELWKYKIDNIAGYSSQDR